MMLDSAAAVAQFYSSFQPSIEIERASVLSIPVSTSKENTPDNDNDGKLPTDFSRVLVVGKSPVNRIVVSKIVERSGLKPISESPETAARALQVFLPGTVVLDGGADNKDCDCILDGIAATRNAAGSAAPAVILLSNRIGTTESLDLHDVIDVVVAKPITPEQLQPVIDRLIARGRS